MRGDRNNTALYGGAAFVLALLIGFAPLPSDPDLWFHLADGEYIASHLQVPQTDPFSCTREGQLWVPHSWLFDVVVALSWHGLGARATEAIFALVFAAAIGLCYRLFRRRGIGPLAALTFCAALAIGAGNTRGLRPQVCSLFLTAVIVYLLVQHKRQPSWRIAVLAAPVFVLWAQLHSACVLGVGLLAIWTVGRLWETAIEQDWPQRRRELIALATTTGVAAVAILITPHAMTHYGYLAMTMNLRYLRAFVAEWQPPHALAFETPDIYLYVLICGLIIALARQARRVGWAEAGVCSVLIVLALSGARHIPLACIGAVPLLAELFAQHAAVRSRFAGISPGSIGGGAVASGFVLLVLWWFPTSAATRYARVEPVRGAAALAALQRPLNVFTTYNTGAYVLWSAPERLRVFVDSRADVYGDDVLMQAHRAMRGEGWESVFEVHRIDAAVVSRRDRLAEILANDADWKCLADDADDRTFIRAKRAVAGVAAP